MQVFKTINSLIIWKYCALGAILVGMYACGSNQKNEFSANKKAVKNFSSREDPPAPSIVLASNPEIIYLDSMPKAAVYEISELNPPHTDTGSFFVSMENFTTEQGLAMDAISASCVDHFGNLWFSTYGGGLSKFDGKTFMNYTAEHGLSNNMVWAITEDKNGNLWFGTDGGGLCKFDGESFSNYTVEDGLGSDIIYTIVEDQKGHLWLGTQAGGLSKFDGSSFTNYTTDDGLSANTIYTIIEDSHGDLWMGTDGEGVCKFDGSSFINYNKGNGLAANTVKYIYEDSKGNIWFATLGGGVSKYDGYNFSNYTTGNGLASNFVLCILEDNEGNLLFGTDGSGFSKYDGENFVNFSSKQGLSNNIIRSISADKSGNLWFGTDGGGVCKYTGRAFTNFFTEQGLPNNVIWSIAEDYRGNLWFGTDGGGVSRYDGNFFAHFTTSQGLVNDVVWCAMEGRDSNLWFGTYGGGVSKFDGKTFTNYTMEQGLSSDIIYAITEDREGNLWFGTHGKGVSKFDGKKFFNYSTANGLSNDIVRVIEEDAKGNIWLATQGGGVSKFDGEFFTHYTTAQGLGNDIVLDILEDEEGILWFGTYNGGVSRFDGKTFVNYTTEDGLPDNTVTQVIETKEGKIALGTNFGIAVLESFATGKSEKVEVLNSHGNEYIKDLKANFQVYNTSTGYLVKDVNTGQNCMFLDSKGAIWIGTGSDKTALVKFEPSGLHVSTAPPHAFIKSVKINEENISWNYLENTPNDSNKMSKVVAEEVSTFGRVLNQNERDSMKISYADLKFTDVSKFYPIPIELVLPYKHNNIEFEFDAIETSRPELLKYQFILEGYDKKWSPILKKNSASFGNIREGSYTFKLKAQNSEGIWSEPISFTFEVLPPWYRTWWAIATYIVLIFLFLYGIYRLRTASLRKDKEMLENTVKERTAELVLQKEEAEKQRNLVEKKNIEITDSINYALRIQQAILPELDEIQSCFPESFILYKPKDIVSGDYYFFYKLKNPEEVNQVDTVFIAAADCTGHGVPGALMSLVGFERLTDAVEQSKDPSQILSMLNRGVKASLHQNHDDSTRDGMDIAFCAVDFKNKKMRYAGANRPLWIIRNGSNVVEEIKGTRAAIGGFTNDNHHFETHELSFEKGDSIYLFSDGYADLFSSNGKKLTIKKFRELILEIQEYKNMNQQKKFLEKFASDWMNGEEQIDDILIIGLKY